jgi:hypothetical protein
MIGMISNKTMITMRMRMKETNQGIEVDEEAHIEDQVEEIDQEVEQAREEVTTTKKISL